MPNPEQLQILKQGVTAWNQWRKDNPDVLPDLASADLKESNLQEADLIGANLIKSNLIGANLNRANLNGADLSAANLSGADLVGADLLAAHLIGADLSKTNLIAANLIGANLNRADLSEADLSEARLIQAHLVKSRLTRASLNEANLNGADLSFANLNDANLSGADLNWTNLSEARLVKARLNAAHLIGADLIGTHLIGADLSRADLSGANLRGANFTGVVISWTVFANNDLSTAKGLDAVTHYGPSSIGIDTIYRSEGKIPEVFLRGCGVPDDFVTYMRSLVGQHIPHHSCFISYSREDQELADQLQTDLQNNKVHCWFASHDLPAGDKRRTGIDEAVHLRGRFLLILSSHSVNSEWVEQEVETALEREKREKRVILFPVRVDDAVMSPLGGWPSLVRNTRSIGDFRNWKDRGSYQWAFERLLRDLKEEA